MNDGRRQDAIVREYLRRLGWGLHAINPDDRDQLMAEISDHIGLARAAMSAPTDDDVRALLDRVGAPEAIVAEAERVEALHAPGATYLALVTAESLLADAVDEAARAGDASTSAPDGGPAAAEPAAALAQRELRTVNLLLAGGLVLVGWLVGVLLLWRSQVFTVRDKVIGTTVLPGGILPAVYLLFHPLGGPGVSLAHLLEVVLCLLLPITTSVYLRRRLRAMEVTAGFESFRARRAAHAAERARNEIGLG